MAEKNYDSLPRDDNRVPVPAGTGIITDDGTIASPYTVPNGDLFSLDIPPTGAEVVIRCDEDIRVTEDVTGTTYFVLPKGITQAFSAARLETLYLQLDSAVTAILNYYFVTV